MKVYIVSYPCCEEYVRDKVFLDEMKARTYTENKTNWLVEEVEVSE